MPYPIFKNLPLLDFSFCELADGKDLLKTPARSGKIRVIPQATATSLYAQQQGVGSGGPPGSGGAGGAAAAKTPSVAGGGGKELSENEEDEEDALQSIVIGGPEDESAATPSKGKKKKKDQFGGGVDGGSEGKSDDSDEVVDVLTYYATNVKLSNNRLGECGTVLTHLKTVVVEAFERITILDISFNQITSIPAELVQLVNLGVLYLHANNIKEIDEVQRLKPLKALFSLSLNGNSIENRKNYRYHILWLLPKLKTLDFISYSKRDRDTIKTYVSFFKPGQPPPRRSNSPK